MKTIDKIKFGLIGNPVKHSLSPAMQNAAFEKCGIDADYRLFEVKPNELEGVLLGESSVRDTEGQEFLAADIAGFNITIPHKVAAREILEKNFSLNNDAKWVSLYSYYVKISGAVNTVKREGDTLKYYNTDAQGFLESLKSDLRFESKDKNILLIGCGGAGRAIIAALAWWKDAEVRIKKIYITDINKQAINSAEGHFKEIQKSVNRNFIDRLQFIPTEDITKVIKKCDLLVNATPIGMKDEDSSVIEKSLLHENLYVYDVVYSRNRETRLIRDAKSLRRPAVDGLSMLLYQGAIAFNLWTGKQAPISIMRDALYKEVKK